MMTCKDADRGFFTYYCENCGTVKTVHFGCNSRICTNCGTNHTDKWANFLNKRKIVQYVSRYIRHLAVANTRLHKYDGKSITFWYKDHDGNKHFVTMEVRGFIKALIQHIPDRNFKMIRYYGAYSRKTKKNYSGYLQRSITQAHLLTTCQGLKTSRKTITPGTVILPPRQRSSRTQTIRTALISCSSRNYMK